MIVQTALLLLDFFFCGRSGDNRMLAIMAMITRTDIRPSAAALADQTSPCHAPDALPVASQDPFGSRGHRLGHRPASPVPAPAAAAGAAEVAADATWETPRRSPPHLRTTRTRRRDRHPAHTGVLSESKQRVHAATQKANPSGPANTHTHLGNRRASRGKGRGIGKRVDRRRDQHVTTDDR